ncbi:FHA domain-containing protein [Miltoncostaea marina]|uniref:FHA domain-containing protein n=1 Tax=Miltoncostaea marina TaxID=2843215 RepID=UPI001C3CDDC2|nr:FHA domain-containing protein [Miltoncostaea marina]
MNETGLIVAQIAFLALLYAFVWTVVRSSARQLRTAQPPPPPPEPAPAPRPRATTPATPAPAPVAAPVAAPEPAVPEPAATAGDDLADRPTQGAWVGAGERLDLSSNLDPRLIVVESTALEEGRTIALEGGLTVGRSGAAGLTIDDQFVSHMHARILRRGAYHFVEDLGSTNGTFLNDRRVERDAQLKVHDTLRIGQTILRYEE